MELWLITSNYKCKEWVKSKVYWSCPVYSTQENKITFHNTYKSNSYHHVADTTIRFYIQNKAQQLSCFGATFHNRFGQKKVSSDISDCIFNSNLSDLVFLDGTQPQYKLKWKHFQPDARRKSSIPASNLNNLSTHGRQWVHYTIDLWPLPFSMFQSSFLSISVAKMTCIS